MEVKSFYYIKCKKDTIDLTLDMLNQGPLPIVWDYKGLCRILRKGVVENIISQLEDVGKSDTLGLGTRRYKIYWDDLSPLYTLEHTGLGCLTA